jgi:hypothetical protein
MFIELSPGALSICMEKSVFLVGNQMERAFPLDLEYLQRYSSFFVFTGMIGKSLYHLLFHTITMLLDEIHSRFGGK